MVEDQKKEGKIICEKCKTAFGYVRLKTNEWQCRACGHIQKIPDEKEIKRGEENGFAE